MKNKFSLTAANLKWIAIVLMFVNHLCYCLYSFGGVDNYFFANAHWYITRISFVIFAYQIAEGMHYTKNRKKYIISLFIFALVSEIPYDLCFNLGPFVFEDQNVFFNLALGALAIAIIDKLDRKPIYAVLVTLASMIIAVLINANYLSLAEVLIVSFYYFRDNKKKQLIISAILFTIFNFTDYMHRWAATYTVAEMLANERFWQLCNVELHGLLAWPLFMLYKGEKGKNINKWFFYLFYPCHLLLLILLNILFWHTLV